MTEMMNEREAIESRHAVREYYDRKIEPEALEDLQREISRCNEESGLNMQLVTEEPRAFDSFMAHYGKFSNVRNYIILAGKKSLDLQEKVGYYGERVAIRAQMLGLNTCWVALTFSRRKVKKFFPPRFRGKKSCAFWRSATARPGDFPTRAGHIRSCAVSRETCRSGLKRA